ncbi:MAG: C39 family peptidase [bacterium]|nr:C39 family peptidase [bacterium]
MRSKKLLISLIAIMLILSGALFATPKIEKVVYRQKVDRENVATLEIVKNEEKKGNYLEVQFITQAPLQTEENWVFHEESCEEAALLQAINYEKGVTISKEEANEIILDMIDWQNKNMGGHHDLYAQDMKKFIMGYYKLKDHEIKIIKNAHIDDIKESIDFNHPVIVPITGDILKNPYYPYPGYHMLIVIGYTEDRIITNDNGTRRGADFSYDTDIFEAAFRDASGDILILNLEPGF